MANIHEVLRYLWRFGIFFSTNLYGFFGYCMWTLTLMPLRVLAPSLYWKIESRLFKAAMSFLILWIDSGGYGVVESGDDIGQLCNEEVLLLSNHQSTADVPLVMLALWNKGSVMANSYWIMYWVFRFTNFGLMSTIRNDVFIKQGKDTRDTMMEMLKNHLKECYLPQGRQWIVLFPEGGFLRNRLETSQKYARKNGYPVLENVTLPRIGAMKVIMDTVGAPLDSDNANISDIPNGNSRGERPLEKRHVKWMVDMTIGYRNTEGAPPDMLGMCIGYRQRQDMHVHYRAYPLSKVPREEDAMIKWLYDRYEEKEQLLNHFKTTGQFPESSGGGVLPCKLPQLISFDYVRVFLIQGFYFASAYLHYTCVLRPICSMLYGMLF